MNRLDEFFQGGGKKRQKKSKNFLIKLILRALLKRYKDDILIKINILWGLFGMF